MKTIVFIKKTFISLCQKAKGTGRKCILCSLLAALCNGVSTAVAEDRYTKPEGDVQVVKYMKAPSTMVLGLFKLKGPQTIILRAADASDEALRKTLKDNPYYPPRPPRSHQYW